MSAAGEAAPMKKHARVAVIGGGVVGASVLYHLAKAGWKDVVLVERDELTSGSTWHAAGGMHTLNGDPNVAKLQEYTINLYAEIEAASGQSCGVHITGGVNLAGTPERMDFLRLARARARYLGLAMEIISVDEAQKLFPLLDKRHFVGALYNPLEGHVDPAGVTNAYAKAARNLGAEVYRFTRVVELIARTDRTWDVVTEKGTIRAEHVVNAGGLWAREVGRMAGLELPVLAMEHQYVITGEVPEVVASPTEMLHVIDFEGEIYMRQEGRGMLIGTYEKAGVPWSERETPWNFTHELLATNLDRIAPSLEVGFRHFPALEHAGIKRVINGPFTFAPDGNPLIGPIRGLSNYWVACGVMAGFSQGGGVGLALANWMIDGDPGFDVWAMDVARFGDWASPSYTHAKVRENYSRRFRIRFPNEELPAARPLRTTPAYERLEARGAVFGAAFGLEHALWFAPSGMEPREDVTYRRSNAHGPVGDECRTVRQAVGLLEIATFARYEVTGAGAAGWLDRVLANRLPGEGRIRLSPMLNDRGRLIGDFTVANAGTGRYIVFGSGIAEQYHRRWFDAHLPRDGVKIRLLADEWMGFAIAGPRSRELLARASPADVSDAAMPFLAFREIEVAGFPVHVGRISFTGELGYEIWVPAGAQVALHDALVKAGSNLGLKHFGARALHSLRLEKSFGNWAREYRPIYTPAEAGLDRFVDLSKPDFIGRAALQRDRSQAPARRLVTFVVDAADADAIGDEPIWHAGKVVGWVTSGGYGHCVRKSIALGYVPASLADATEGFEIEILGERRRAERVGSPLYDPAGIRMRRG
jgi:dimethylglycine dehydrogenase